ncbi:MAG: hypothetical protein ACI9S8_001047 [Chlamydiales bacterium]|jgi:hypothetical protein
MLFCGVGEAFMRNVVPLSVVALFTTEALEITKKICDI